MKKRTNKLTLLENNRYSILTNDLNRCYICWKPKDHLHEVFYGKNRQNSMKYGCVIPVCFNCHTRIHNDIKLDTNIKKKMQKAFMIHYFTTDFIDIFHRNYL